MRQERSWIWTKDWTKPQNHHDTFCDEIADEDDTLHGDLANLISSFTPAKPHRRRLSTAPSVLPALAADMTMLLLDHGDIAPFGASLTADFDSLRTLRWRRCQS